MTALDVISVAQAKNWLSVDPEETEWDDAIEALIEVAVGWVETYTSYFFYPREQQIETSGCATGISSFPVSVTAVVDKNNVAIHYRTKTSPLKLWVYTQPCAIISLMVGYDDPTLIPKPLISACYKLITYVFENRDAYGTTLPLDVQVLVNQYRRGFI